MDGRALRAAPTQISYLANSLHEKKKKSHRFRATARRMAEDATSRHIYNMTKHLRTD